MNGDLHRITNGFSQQTDRFIPLIEPEVISVLFTDEKISILIALKKNIASFSYMKIIRALNGLIRFAMG
jgi:hypothetical protein